VLFNHCNACARPISQTREAGVEAASVRENAGQLRRSVPTGAASRDGKNVQTENHDWTEKVERDKRHVACKPKNGKAERSSRVEDLEW